MKNSKLLAIFLSVLLVSLSGCSDKKEIDAWNEFDKRCKGKVKATLNKGGWNSYLTLECADFNPTTKAN
ncbi:MAG: hypothetical protein GY920_21975 [Aliivibrio sp.]|nr:hypothetical protein [Aliivibrio sp.]MCP4255423.1 hypothetical protein [Candidatus Scalindua sp.]